MKPLIAGIIVLLLNLSCNNTTKPPVDASMPRVVKAHGYVIPKDKLLPPVVIPAKEPVIVPAGKPRLFVMPSNIHKAGIAKIHRTPGKVSTPGQNGLALPATVPVVGKTTVAGTPEVVVARDAFTKDQNAQNFNFFTKMQGLAGDEINCLTEDRNGNLWIGTKRGGASKYDGKNFTNYSARCGLSNYILSILEDSKGNMWFGTMMSGVFKYDGYQFTQFTTNEGLSDDDVLSLFEDKKGNIWLGTSNGVNKYDGKSLTIYGTREGIANSFIVKIMEDKNGNLWFGTWKGVEKFDGKTFIHYDPIADSHVRGIYEDKDGKMWFATDNGISIYDEKTFTYYTRTEGLSAYSLEDVQVDIHGNIWLPTYWHGANRFNGKEFVHFTSQEGLDDNLRCMLADKRGNIWFGTYRNGISKYNGSRITHLTGNEGLSDSWIRSILEDRDGKVWFGGQTGGVNVYDGKSFAVYTDSAGMMGGSVQCSLQDKKGNLWFGHGNGICKFDGKNFYQFQMDNMHVFAMLEDKKGDLWLCTFKSGVYKYDGHTFTNFTDKQGLGSKIVSDVAEDQHGNLWFGTFGGGLVKYDGRNFTHFTTKGGLNDNDIYAIEIDRNENMWIGYFSYGASKFDGQYFTHYTDRQGLVFNGVRSIMEDKKGNLWFGTYSGLSRMDNVYASSTKNLPGPYFKNYSHEDGLTGIEVNNGNTLYESKDGAIWIGTKDRLSILHPENDLPDTICPNIQLTDLTLFNERIDWKAFHQSGKGEKSENGIRDTTIELENGVNVHDIQFSELSKWYSVPQNLSLAYDNNYLTFHFVGITTNAPKQVKYQYKLEGFDRTWAAITSRSEATYGNLPFGTYTFVVKAMNGDGYWSNENRYSFVIRPPWWHTWWAYTLFGVSALAVIYSIFRYRENRMRMRHEIVLQKHNVEELKMQALRAQMNPHFIFNSLHSINLFILENNKLQAAEYLTKFSRLIRLILHNSQEAFIPLARELEALELYLELESLRFEQRFQYRIAVADEIDSRVLSVPPLIIQPYVENAIWHGLMPKKEAGILDIEVYPEGEIIFCKITDNGVGRKKAVDQTAKATSVRKSMGMLITAERIALLQNDAPSESHVTINDLVLSDGSPGGTQVVIKIRASYD